MIKKMLSDDDIRLTYPVMNQLRTHVPEHEYLGRVKRQSQTSSYQIAALFNDGKIGCVAGYRIHECLAWGKIMYVDDLVSDQNGRSRSYGKRMLTWLVDQAKASECQEFHLDSGVQRHAAHRFYLRE